ncbi:Calx-beta domain-containing protein, partial [Fulvivirga sp.]
MKILNRNIWAIVLMLPLLWGCFDDPGTDVTLGDVFVSLSNDSQQTSEDQVTGEILLEISRAQSSAVDVDYELTSTNAINGVDFELQGSSVTIPAGEFSTSIPYTVTDNNVFEPEARSFTVTLTGVSASSVSIQGNTAITVGILNNDCPVNTSVWFGDLSVEDVGFGAVAGSGAANANGDCDILVITGDYVGAPLTPVTWNLTPSSPGATSGTAVAPRQAYTCCDPTAYEYEASGTYD